VDVFDAALRSWPRAMAAALTYHPTRARWRQRYGLGTVPFLARSMRAGRALNAQPRSYDAIIQIGATFTVDQTRRADLPYVLYCDSNIAHSRRGAPYSSASRLSEREYLAAFRREKSIYDAADRIWTMSDALAESFRNDFGQPAEKVLTIYAGMNNRPSTLSGARRQRRILFVGKDHERKGSQTLLRALEIVRRAIPDAELDMVGPNPAEGHPPGVVAHGILSRETEAGRAVLDELFSTCSVFCMPSRYEPFGIAFVEAMSAGLPCIGTTKWAMPEIIADGETGWLVADGSVDDLAAALITALTDASLCERMGARGRERALSRFTWDSVAARAASDLTSLIAGRVPCDEATVSI
jgi:glycosyltransferase involved in cell wall biosynthesis